MSRPFFPFVPWLASLALWLGGAPALAQNWRWVSPKPQGVAVNAVAFAGSQGWLVGNLGTISTTTDSAQTFISQVSGTSANLNGVFFLDANHGWAVGDAGTILATSDGGQHWIAQSSQSSRKLRGVFFTSVLKGFAVGDYRTLLETEDGGTTWAGLGSQVLSLDAVTFTDSLHGFICGDTGAILVTTDGGTTFNLVQTGTTAHLLAINFADANHGFAVGLGGVVVTTSDGGHSWSSQVIGSDDLIGVQAATATAVYALGASGSVYSTIDGVDWELGEVEQAIGAAAFTALALEADGSLDITAASGQWFHASDFADAGPARGLVPAFLDVNDLFSRSSDVTAAAFGSQDAGVMIAELGYLFNTLDRGVHLKVVGPPDAGADIGWTAVSMPTPTDAFAVGSQGAIAVSHDSGQTWSFITAPVVDDFTAVQFLDAQHGFLTGSSGLIYITDSAGAGWSIVGSGVSSSINALAFNDLQHGVAVADFGQVLSTVDGIDFTLSGVSIPFTLFAAAYPAPGVVIVAGEFGELSHSLNQGLTFFDLTPPTEASIQALAFLDHQNGYLGGGTSDGSVWVTRDGAQTFGMQFTGASSILGLSFPDRLHGYAVGGNGAMLTTDTGGESACQSDADCLDGGPYGVQCLEGACQPCTQDDRCGPTCAPCPADTPTCYGGYCGACLNDMQCPANGYCVLGICQAPSIVDGGEGDGGEGDGGSDDGGPADAGDGGAIKDGGRGTTGGTTTGTSTPPDTCANDPKLCGSGCGCRNGGGSEAVWATLLALAVFLSQRRRREVPLPQESISK